MIARADRETKGQIETLLGGGTLDIRVHEDADELYAEGYRKMDCYGTRFTGKTAR